MSDLSHIYFAGVGCSELYGTSSAARSESGLCNLQTRDTSECAHPEYSARGAELDPLLSWVLARAGLDAAAYRSAALQRRLPACLRTLRVASAEEARAALERAPELLGRAVSTILIGASGFFRDLAVFEYLEASVLPELLKEQGGIRAFSAGCSQGQELYSIAMLLSELGALEDSRLLGVDCRPDAVAQASAGIFALADLNGVGPERLRRHFDPVGAQFAVKPRLCNQTEWQVANLLACQSENLWDLVLFRNVGIYLESEPSGRIWQWLGRCLTPGGVIVTGRAGRPPTGLPLRKLASCIYQRID